MMRRSITDILLVPYISQVHMKLLPPTEALVYAKKEIDHAPIVNEDPILHAPLFRNISVFKRYSLFFVFPSFKFCIIIHHFINELSLIFFD